MEILKKATLSQKKRPGQVGKAYEDVRGAEARSITRGNRDQWISYSSFTANHEFFIARETTTRLYLGETPDNYIDVPTADIVRFEELDSYLPPAVSSAPARGLDSVVSAASKRNNLDPDLVNSVILVESGFDPNAVSP